MSFSNLFYEYEKQLKIIKKDHWKNIKNNLQCYQIVIMCILLFIFGLSVFEIIRKDDWFYKLGFVVLIIIVVCLLLLLCHFDSKEENVRKRQMYIILPYEKNRRAALVSVLNEYGVDTSDRYKVELLIKEAQEQRNRYDYFKNLNKPLNLLGAVFVLVVNNTVSKIYMGITAREAICIICLAMVLFIQIYAIIMMFKPMFKDIIYKKYNVYSEFIEILNQMLLFPNLEKCSRLGKMMKNLNKS